MDAPKYYKLPRGFAEDQMDRRKLCKAATFFAEV